MSNSHYQAASPPKAGPPLHTAMHYT